MGGEFITRLEQASQCICSAPPKTDFFREKMFGENVHSQPCRNKEGRPVVLNWFLQKLIKVSKSILIHVENVIFNLLIEFERFT